MRRTPLLTLAILLLSRVGLTGWSPPLARAEPPEQATVVQVKETAEKKVPPPQTSYRGRRIAVTMHYEGAPWLVRESRQREEDCQQLLKELNVQPGQTICDMGCGNGFYTLPLARLVGPRGKVYAVEIQPEMLTMLRQHIANRSVVVANGPEGPSYPPTLAGLGNPSYGDSSASSGDSGSTDRANPADYHGRVNSRIYPIPP